MHITILEHDKKKLIFEVDETNHTISNALKMELWDNKDTKVSGYHVSHPLVGKVRFHVEMKTGDAKKAVEDALDSLKKKFADAEKQAAKL